MPTVDDLIAQAAKFQAACDLQSAEQYCRRALEIDCARVETLCLLAAVCHALGKSGEATSYLTQAIRRHPSNAEAHNHVGVLFAQQGQVAEAIASFTQASRLAPGSAEIANNLRHALAISDNRDGILLAGQGKPDEAAALFRRALERNRDYAEAHNNLGLALAAQGKLDEAADCCRSAIALKPDYAEAHNNLGTVLVRQGKPDEAAASFRRAIELKPDYAKAHNNLGAVLLKQEQADAAEHCCRRALQLDPGLADAHNNLGNALKKMRHFGSAVSSYKTALEIRPDFVEARQNLGLALRSRGLLEEAAACFQQLLKSRPDLIEARNNLGTIYQAQGLLGEARACFDEALSRDPSFASAYYNRGMLWLTEGNFEQGWNECEWRSRPTGETRSFKQRVWDGSSLQNRTILLRPEQGLGDTLQFIRYLPLLRKMGAHVVVEVQPSLVPLLRASGLQNVFAWGSELPEFDVQASMMSLPRLFRTRLDTIPADVPYLNADPVLTDQWRQRLALLRGFKVGIHWQGNPDYEFDALRSIPLLEFAPLAEVPNVCLISLQRKEGLDQLAAARERFAIHELGDDVDCGRGAFVDTAAVMKNLDLVVTSDTAAAHLAGALGVPVWMALPFVPEWRWMLGRGDSPWYPTMQLFRQTRLGDWQGVFWSITNELAAMA